MSHMTLIFCLQISFFSENNVLVCGRVGVSGIKSIFFFFLDDVPYTEMWINGKWNNMCAMHERQQEEAEPWLKSGISGWIREETNANMSKATGVGNHFYLWITPYNWDDNKGSFQKRFSGFFPLRGYPPYPLNGKSFCQKTLSGKGGYPLPPLNGKSLFPKTFNGKGGDPPP